MQIEQEEKNMHKEIGKRHYYHAPPPLQDHKKEIRLIRRSNAMNHNIFVSLFVLLICIVHYCFGDPGCMDNSWHLKQPYDYKEFHYVTSSDGGYCKCQCSKHIAQYGKQFPRGRCPVCKHYRVPQPVVIIKNALEAYKKYVRNHPEKKCQTHKKQRLFQKSNIFNMLSWCKNR